MYNINDTEKSPEPGDEVVVWRVGDKYCFYYSAKEGKKGKASRIREAWMWCERNIEKE